MLLASEKPQELRSPAADRMFLVPSRWFDGATVLAGDPTSDVRIEFPALAAVHRADANPIP